MEWIWRPMNESLGETSQIFAHTLYNHYCSPSGFDFDSTVYDDYSPFISDPNLDTYNAPEKAVAMHNWITNMSQHYRSNNLFITMGCDFAFQDAH